MPDASPKRLQEYSTPSYYTEKFENYKRIHAQQNRELARVNSMFAIRIQKLENEVIALRNENLELREELLRVNHCVIQEKHVQSAHDPCSSIDSTDIQLNNQFSDKEQNDDEQQSYQKQQRDEDQQNHKKKKKDQRNPKFNQVARRARAPVNYALPSIKKKLRKGDPHTFKTSSE